ncbi:MAG TPA: PfkB family carbohydrate kinase [Anaerolineaceae bacterium]
MPYDLVCLGNLSIDDVVLPDQTTRPNCFGGDTIYGALGARWWSDSVRFVAPAGADFPAENLDYLEKAGLETRGLPRRSIPGVHYRVVYHSRDQRTWTMLSEGGDFGALSPSLADIPADYLDASAFLILAMDLGAQEALAPALHARGMLALDPQEEYIPGNEARVLAMLADVDIFLPSQEEIFLLFGHRDYETACRELAARGPQVVVVKLGQAGSLVYDARADSFHRIPIYKTQTLDTTGAGDTYSGGFTAMYVRNGDLVKAGLAGAVSASFAVEGFGLSHMFAIPAAAARQRLSELEAQYRPAAGAAEDSRRV